MSGLFDAEGSVWLRGNRQFGPQISFTNKDTSLLEWIASYLKELGLYAWTDKPNSAGVSRVFVWRREDVIKLLSRMAVRHPEKKAKSRLLLEKMEPQSEVKPGWHKALAGIEADCREFLKLAEYDHTQHHLAHAVDNLNGAR